MEAPAWSNMRREIPDMRFLASISYLSSICAMVHQTLIR